jgi:Domain of unknown function (DUF4326)
VRIDRLSKWGNPFKIGRDGTRDDVIRKYREYFSTSPLMQDLDELRGKILVCWCSPLPCHGDVLVEYIRKEVV